MTAFIRSAPNAAVEVCPINVSTKNQRNEDQKTRQFLKQRLAFLHHHLYPSFNRHHPTCNNTCRGAHLRKFKWCLVVPHPTMLAQGNRRPMVLHHHNIHLRPIPPTQRHTPMCHRVHRRQQTLEQLPQLALMDTHKTFYQAFIIPFPRNFPQHPILHNKTMEDQ